jgi:hypothetical protein
MAAGYCSRSLLLHGPSGSGKTELVHAVAAELGANLLYVPGGESLLKTYQQEGHRLLRALFAVSWWVVCGWVGRKSQAFPKPPRSRVHLCTCCPYVVSTSGRYTTSGFISTLISGQRTVQST